jgi:hypothetical protein
MEAGVKVYIDSIALIGPEFTTNATISSALKFRLFVTLMVPAVIQLKVTVIIEVLSSN